MPPKKINATSSGESKSPSGSSKIAQELFREFESEYNRIRSTTEPRIDWEENFFKEDGLIHDLFIYKAPAGQQCRLILAGKAVLQYLVDIMIEIMFMSENMNAKNLTLEVGIMLGVLICYVLLL